MIYYIADTHFGHTNVLRFDNRPFNDIASMEEALIHNWNKRITDEDDVYILGDCFWKNEENSINIIKKLRGRIHLIKGNHDRVNGKLKNHYHSIKEQDEINDNGRLVIVSHYPMLFYKNQRYGAYMLYGHVHNSLEWNFVEKWKKELWDVKIPCRIINVGCMMEFMNFTPRTLDELIASNPMPEFN